MNSDYFNLARTRNYKFKCIRVELIILNLIKKPKVMNKNWTRSIQSNLNYK